MERLTERKWTNERVVDLLPCPCCGESAMRGQDDLEIRCRSCGLTTGRRESITIATGTWNRRVAYPHAPLDTGAEPQ